MLGDLPKKSVRFVAITDTSNTAKWYTWLQLKSPLIQKFVKSVTGSFNIVSRTSKCDKKTVKYGYINELTSFSSYTNTQSNSTTSARVQFQ